MKLAIGLAKKYSHKDILTAYLNIAYFGDQTYGVQAAAQHYFNKNATDLTPQEAASILAIVSRRTRATSPSRRLRRQRRPSRRHPEVDARAEAPHQGQYDAAIASKPADYVDLTEPNRAASPPQATVPSSSATTPSRSSSDVAARWDREGTHTAWRNGGYTIQTSLDINLNGQQKDLLNAHDPNTRPGSSSVPRSTRSRRPRSHPRDGAEQGLRPVPAVASTADVAELQRRQASTAARSASRSDRPTRSSPSSTGSRTGTA